MKIIDDTKSTVLKGEGKQGGQIGHRRTLNGEKKEYLHGLGCARFDNCFECELPECTWRA